MKVTKRPHGPDSLLVRVAVVLCVCFWALPPHTAPAADPSELNLVRSFGPDGTELSSFGHVMSVAYDQSDDVVYVVDQGEGKLYKFDSAGHPMNWGGSAGYIVGNAITGLSFYSSAAIAQVAVDPATHKVYVNTTTGKLHAFHADGEPALFSAGPGAGTNTIDFTLPRNPSGVAIDANSNIYVSEFDAGVVKIFAPSGEPITQLTAPKAGNVAVNTNGVVYVNQVFTPPERVLKFIPSSFPVTAGTTYTEAPTPITSTSRITVAVDPATNHLYVASAVGDAKIEVYDDVDLLLTTFAEEGEVERVGGVAIDGDTTTVYVGNKFSSLSGPELSQVRIFAPKPPVEPAPPSIERIAVSDVGSRSAELHAWINPNLVATTYRFEYGTGDCALSACASVPAGGEDIGPGLVPISRSHFINDLDPGTTYHYRVVAENSLGVTTGPSRTFTTQLSGIGFELADDRAWEMVSPSNKHGARLTTSPGHLQASADGESLAYLSAPSIESAPDGQRSEISSALARRQPGGAWTSKDISSANDRALPLALGQESEFKLFSPDLSTALLEPRSTAMLSSEASERTPYLRTNTEPAAYDPLVTGKEGFANVPPGAEFGGDPDFAIGDVVLDNANPELTHVVLRSSVPLTEGAPSGPGISTLYQWAAGQLEPVSVLPAAEGGAIVNAQFTGSGKGSMRGAISQDGSRVFWSTGNYPSATDLYMRDTEADLTARLDVVQPGASGSGTARPTFQGASADGTVVFFTDSRQLTEGASPSGFDLYRCEIPEGEEAAGCSTLTDISAPLEGSGESAEVQGIVAAIGEDGTRAYFVANGVLDEAPNGHGDSAEAGGANLYLWQQGSGVRFIAALDPVEDRANWGEVSTDPDASAARLSAAASPSGRYLAFMSQRSLTGYDNRDAANGEPAQEVFRYDAVADALHCASCNPSGALPSADAHGSRLTFSDPRNIWESRLVAAVLPQAMQLEISGRSLYRTRSVLDNGRVFFNAVDPLVPADSNGQWDVYQHEPTGTGSCGATSGDADTARSGDGCVSLISSGTAEEEAGFLDASQSGDDVFFLTSARLSVTDEDQEYDVYDARVNGIPATLEPLAECLGEACQPAVVAPNDPTPPSAAFKGAGNLVAAQNCGAMSHRTGKLARRAKALRRKAKQATNPQAAKRLRRKAGRHARKARGLSRRATRCRGANRRVNR